MNKELFSTQDRPPKIKIRQWLTENGYSLPTIVVKPGELASVDLMELFKAMNDDIKHYGLKKHGGLVIRSVIPYSPKWGTKMLCLTEEKCAQWDDMKKSFMDSCSSSAWFMIHLDDSPLQEKCLHARIGLDRQNGIFFTSCDSGSNHARILDCKVEDNFQNRSIHSIALFLKSRYPVIQADEFLNRFDRLTEQFPHSNQFEFRIYPNGKIFVLGVD